VGELFLIRLGVEQRVGAASGGAAGVGVAGSSGCGRVPGAGGAPEDGAFRICPKLNYRARRELKRLEWSRKQHACSSGGDGVERDSALTTLARLRERLEHERAQNEELLSHVRSKGKIIPLVFGDIIQVQWWCW
jgi:hypothetical protein